MLTQAKKDNYDSRITDVWKLVRNLRFDLVDDNAESNGMWTLLNDLMNAQQALDEAMSELYRTPVIPEE